MRQLHAYLTFNGNCAEAMRFYEQTLGGQLERMMTHAEAPTGAQAPPGNADRVMHATITIDGQVLMASDSLAGQPYAGMHGFSLSLTYGSADEAKRGFEALSQGGKVTMPLQKTFWASAFGMLTDRFGVPWMISCEAHES